MAFYVKQHRTIIGDIPPSPEPYIGDIPPTPELDSKREVCPLTLGVEVCPHTLEDYLAFQ